MLFELWGSGLGKSFMGGVQVHHIAINAVSQLQERVRMETCMRCTSVTPAAPRPDLSPGHQSGVTTTLPANLPDSSLRREWPHFRNDWRLPLYRWAHKIHQNQIMLLVWILVLLPCDTDIGKAQLDLLYKHSGVPKVVGHSSSNMKYEAGVIEVRLEEAAGSFRSSFVV